ncbi:MAG TPA: hypothetical protein VFW23_08245, partial [Tepidisphaeraceae bacterium]|nr:hypothetical protein [Tepidisphaeraceae bacterium]
MGHNPVSQRGDNNFSWRLRCLMRISHFSTLLLLSCGITLSMTSPVQAAPNSIADRGQHLISLLHRAMYVAAKNQGVWPQSMPFVDQDVEKIVYARPHVSAAGQFENLYLASTVVLNEEPRFHRDGFWIGYLDGHIEFVKSAQEFDECKEQLRIIQDAVKRFGNPVDPPAQNGPALAMPPQPLKV